MPGPTAEPLSPELILVSPPELAALAREQLPDPPESLRSEPRVLRIEPTSADSSEVSWNDFLADVRTRSVEPTAVAQPRPPVQARRNGRRRLLVGIAAIVAVAALVGLALARDRGQQEPGSAPASMPVPQHHQASRPKSATHANTTPAPAVTRAAAPKRSKPRPGASRAAGFVPTRVWSWARAPGAGAYVVRFLRDGNKVLKIRTLSPRLVLPSGFSFAPGRYRWTVTAMPRHGKRGHVIVNSSFLVGAQNG